MNKTFLILALSATIAASCSKTEKQNAADSETSLVQEAQILKCENGSTLTAIYFADGDMVAVRIKKDQEAEQKLSAKGTNPNGDPYFGNSTYTWELLEDGKAGRLTHKGGSNCIYR